jgi:hypothetical protein
LIPALIAAAAVAGLAPAFPATAGPSCPIGQHEDTQTPGFQCVPGWCPSGTLLDGVTRSCVAPPGVPPPPLS